MFLLEVAPFEVLDIDPIKALGATYHKEQENYNEAHCSLGHVVNLRNPFSSMLKKGKK